MTQLRPDDVRARMVRLVLETRDLYPRQNHAIEAKLGVSPGSLRNCVRHAEVDPGALAETTTEDAAQVKALQRETTELRRANEILKAAASRVT